MRQNPSDLLETRTKERCPHPAGKRIGQVKIVATNDERSAALRLVHDAYVDRGLMKAHGTGQRITQFHAHRASEVFIATERDEALLTASLALDRELGLPMETVFADLVAERRGRGLVLAEVFCLASQKRSIARTTPLVRRLVRAMLRHCRSHAVDLVLIAVHPRHARFYSTYFDFRNVSDIREHPQVLGNPAVVCALDLRSHAASAHDPMRSSPAVLTEQASKRDYRSAQPPIAGWSLESSATGI